MTDELTPVGEESCSSNVQRICGKNVAKSSRIATLVRAVERKSALDELRIPPGGFITEGRAKHFEMHLFLILPLKVPTTEISASLKSLARFPKGSLSSTLPAAYLFHTQFILQYSS
jgi:hypothetical protein